MPSEEEAGYFNNAAVVAVKAGKFKEAIKLYETALKSLKTDKLKHIIYYNLGLSHRRDGNIPEATKMMKRAIKYKPDYEKAKKQLEQLSKATVRKSGLVFDTFFEFATFTIEEAISERDRFPWLLRVLLLL